MQSRIPLVGQKDIPRNSAEALSFFWFNEVRVSILEWKLEELLLLLTWKGDAFWQYLSGHFAIYSWGRGRGTRATQFWYLTDSWAIGWQCFWLGMLMKRLMNTQELRWVWWRRLISWGRIALRISLAYWPPCKQWSFLLAASKKLHLCIHEWDRRRDDLHGRANNGG